MFDIYKLLHSLRIGREGKGNEHYTEVTGRIRYLIDFKVMELAAKKLSLSNIYCINHKLGLRIEQKLEMGDATPGTCHHLTQILSIFPNSRFSLTR